MDILFDDTSVKKKRKVKGLASKSSGFAKEKKKKPVLNLFGDDDIFKKPEKQEQEKPKPKEDPQPKSEKQEEKDPEKILDSFLKEHPEILPFIRIQPFTEFGLTPEQLRQRIATSAAESFVRIQQCSPIIVKMTDKVEKSYAKINKKYGKQVVPKGASLKRIGLYYLNYYLRLKRIDLIKENIDKVSDCILFIGHLVNIFSTNNIEKELKILIPQIELALTEFPEKNEKCKRIKKTVRDIDRILQEPLIIDTSFSAINSFVIEDPNPIAGYFPDCGLSEGLFELSLENLTNEQKAMLKKRINVSREHPNAIGKAILAESNSYIRHFGLDPSASLQILFILFARYFFVKLYESTICESILNFDNTLFISRIKQLRKISPIGFGLSGNFLPEQLKSIPLDNFPAANPYSKAVGHFERLQFQICPLDFCKAVHDALKEIQSVASGISYQTKSDETGGKIFAKGDHLLCLDDLFDISLIILILAAPISLQAMVEQFEPYIQSLEMTAELEFAFTNISAMVRHIVELNIDKVTNDAKTRTRQALEIDPLRILASRKE